MSDDSINKGGKGSGVKGHTTQKLKEIHSYHKEHSSEETQESMKRYLHPGATDPDSHAYRVHTEHATMGQRGSDRKPKPKSESHHMNEEHQKRLSQIFSKKRVKKSDPLNPEPIYEAQEKPYGSQDLNDMIEAQELEKGGVGSGKKGHLTPKKSTFNHKKEKYSWGTFRNLEAKDHSHSVPIHPEHWNEIKGVHSGKKPKGSFKDETGKHWNVERHPEGGVGIHHQSSNGNFKHHLSEDHMKDLDDAPTFKEGSSYKHKKT